MSKRAVTLLFLLVLIIVGFSRFVLVLDQASGVGAVNESLAGKTDNSSEAIDDFNFEIADEGYVDDGIGEQMIADYGDFEIEQEDAVGSEFRALTRATASLTDDEVVALKSLRANLLVRQFNGELVPPYEVFNLCTEAASCSEVVLNSKSQLKVYDQGWAPGFVLTGVGQEVVKVR